MFKKVTNLVKSAGKKLRSSQRLQMAVAMMLVGTTAAMAQNSVGDYTAGTTALGTVTTEIAKYIPYVVKLCYAIAGVVAVVGAISVYIAMNNEEQDVKKSLLLGSWEIGKRKQMKLNKLTHNIIKDFLNLDFLARSRIQNINNAVSCF